MFTHTETTTAVTSSFNIAVAQNAWLHRLDWLRNDHMDILKLAAKKSKHSIYSNFFD